MELRASRHQASLRIEVADPSPKPPVVRHPDPADDHGRGILLIDSLASAWGVVVRPDGKTVWFEIEIEVDCASRAPRAARSTRGSVKASSRNLP